MPLLPFLCALSSDKDPGSFQGKHESVVIKTVFLKESYIFFIVTFHLLKRPIVRMEDFGIFYENQRKKLFSYLLRVSGDYSLSMDIMQESFTR